MADSVDPDEMARYELFHLGLHCLHRYLFWSARLKGLTFTTFWANSADNKMVTFFFFFTQKMRFSTFHANCFQFGDSLHERSKLVFREK